MIAKRYELRNGVSRVAGPDNPSVIDGTANATFAYLGVECSVEIRVSGSATQPRIGFRNEVLSSLTRAGCNTGKCHGSASGKDGFRLSLFGYDPSGDQYRLTRERSGRRVQLADPKNSLVVLKAIGSVPHTGGGCIDEGSRSYDSLVQWLHEGAKPDAADAIVPLGIEVFPKKSVFAKPQGQQKLIVMASYSDGSRRDVTSKAVYLSNNDAAASVSKEGLVDARGPGAAFILARFDQFTQGSSIMVRPDLDFDYPTRPVSGMIDTLVDDRLRFMHLAPSSGGSLENPPTNYYQMETTPQLLAENVAQVFMGTRIQCAQCHNHPFDRWTMDDYYGFASFFSQVGYKQAEDPRELTIYNAVSILYFIFENTETRGSQSVATHIFCHSVPNHDHPRSSKPLCSNVGDSSRSRIHFVPGNNHRRTFQEPPSEDRIAAVRRPGVVVARDRLANTDHGTFFRDLRRWKTGRDYRRLLHDFFVHCGARVLYNYAVHSKKSQKVPNEISRFIGSDEGYL